jgi:hypothetical protein
VGHEAAKKEFACGWSHHAVGGAITPCDVEASNIDMHQGNALVPTASIVVPSASTIEHC